MNRVGTAIWMSPSSPSTSPASTSGFSQELKAASPKETRSRARTRCHWLSRASPATTADAEAVSEAAGMETDCGWDVFDMMGLSSGSRRGRWPSSRSEEHKDEIQSLMRNTYGGLCLKKKNK